MQKKFHEITKVKGIKDQFSFLRVFLITKIQLILRSHENVEGEKELALEDFNARGEDTSSLLDIFWLFELIVLLLCQTFSALSYHRRKSVLDTLIDGKAKVKELLIEQYNSLNSFKINFQNQ